MGSSKTRMCGLVFVIIAKETRVFCPPLSVLIFRPAISTAQREAENESTLGDPESRELRSDLLLVVLRVVVFHQLEGRFVEVQLVHVVLREHAAAQLVVPDHLSLERDQIAQEKLWVRRRREREKEP